MRMQTALDYCPFWCYTRPVIHDAAPYLSIVIPAYNEERRLPRTLERLFDPQVMLPSPFEVIIVDDGSRDGTAQIVRDAMAQHAEIRLLQNPHSGKAYTVRTGILAARGRYCLHADADLSTPPIEFRRLVEALEAGAEIAIGCRCGRPGAPAYRLLMSNGWKLLVRLLGLGNFQDTQCGFKAFRTAAVHEIYARTRLYNNPARSLANPSVTAAADVEVLYIAQRLGYNIAEVSLDWVHAEDTKIQPLRDSAHAFVDLLRIRWFALTRRYS